MTHSLLQRSRDALAELLGEYRATVESELGGRRNPRPWESCPVDRIAREMVSELDAVLADRMAAAIDKAESRA